MEYKIDTKIFENGHIEQNTFLEMDHKCVSTRIFRTVIDTQEEQIREALIKLGWTPPDINQLDAIDSIDLKIIIEKD